MRTARIVIAPVVVTVLLGLAPSATADKILFQRDGGMWLMRSDGSGERRLPIRDAFWPDLSPDGQRLVWSANGSLVTGTINGRRRRVAWRGTPVTYAAPASPTLVRARWSPSRRQIAATMELFDGPFPADWNQSDEFSQVFVVRPGGRPRMLSTPIGMSNPNWSPDGRRIVAGGYRSENSCAGIPVLIPPFTCETTLFTGLWVINVASGAAREILHVDGPRYVGESIGEPVWSPDGRTIAFVWTPDRDAGAAQVWTVRPDGTGLYQVTRLPRSAEAPSWSPDGRRLAFATTGRTGGSRIATIRADGSRLRILTGGWRPDWSR